MNPSADNCINSQKIAAILAAIAAIPEKGRVLITIDGPCASGKTTLARELCRRLDAPCVHTDDFVIPHARKTPERLAIPGGNQDTGRLMAEVVTPWLETGCCTYSPYDCMADRLAPPVAVGPSRLLVLEGSYSNMPPIAARASVRVFLTIDREEQLGRLAQRNPDRLAMFQARWIPLEEAYHAAYSLPDDGCLVLSGC